MQPAPLRANEAAALLALDELAVLDSGPDAEFDALARAASLLCDVPIALISLIDAQRQWFKSAVGLDGIRETPRELAFCAHAVLGADVFEVPDAALDPRFADNPLVTGQPDIRFYAGAPLRLSGGEQVGTLCLIDRVPRALTETQRAALQALAVVAAQALESRRARQLAEEGAVALMASEARYRSLYQTTPAMLHAIDPEGRLLMVSDAWLERLGYAREDVLGRRSTEFFTEASREMALREGLPTLLARGWQREMAVQMLGRSGEVVDILLSAIVERDPAGRPLRVLAGLQDVTLRRRAERALEAEKQRLLNIIEGTQSGIWEWNIQTGELRLNERSAAMLGQTLAELGTQTIALRTQCTHPDDLPAAAAAMRLHLSGRSAHYEVESRVRHADGHWVWVLDRGRVLTHTPDGKPEWMFGIHQNISPRKQQEAALRQSEELLQRTGRLAGVGGWELDLASSEVTWSAQTHSIHGVPADYRPLLASAINFYAPEARPVIQAAVERCRADGTPWDLELPLITADGRRIWVRAVGSADFEAGQAVRLSGAFQDITERKRLESRLIDKERFLRQALDSVPGLIAHISPDRRYTLVNRAYTAWDDRPQAELVGRRVAEVHGQAGYALLAPQLDRAFAGEVVAFEVELQRGTELHAMQVTYVPDFDEAEQVIGVFSMKVDVTPLRRAEERLRLVMEASPQGMFTSDLQGLCTYTNAAWQRIAGCGLAQSLGLGMRDVIHPDDLPQLMAKSEAALHDGGIQSSEHRYRRPDGSVVWVRGHLTLLRRNGVPDSFIGTVEDVTQRRLLDEALALKTTELARSNEELERFAYVASHDLQEPLRMVTSYGQLLAHRHLAELSPDGQEFLQFMFDGGQRAQALIRDLLSLARLDSQASPWQPVALEAVLADSLAQLQGPLQAAGAVVTHDPLPTVLADAGQMAQLFGNLLSNALKFHGAAAAHIHVAAERVGTSWRISVHDNGVGIEAQFFERIFVMFQRLHLRSAYEGTGIGLAICKKVVERHGGRIGVASKPGQGSTFFFTLPDHAADASAEHAAPAHA